MIRLEGISREWPEFAIRDITLEIRNGEYLTIVGPTGAGKTLLLELILGFHRPDKGRIFLDGVDVTCTPPEKRGIGMVYQDYLLFPHLDVAGNMAFGLRYQQTSATENDSRLQEAARLLGIEHLLHRYPATLSGGEKQRVAIGRALVTKPRLLLLDEPLSALDWRNARRLRTEIQNLHRIQNLTIIHVTHNLAELRAFGGQIALIDEGVLRAFGRAEDMLRRPPTAFAANFFGCVNVLEAQCTEGSAWVQSGPLKAQRSGPNAERYHIVVHPDEVALLPPIVEDGPNRLRAVVSNLTDEGSHVSVAINVDGLKEPMIVYTNRHTVTALSLMPGEPVAADVGENLHVLAE
jgi:molybdate/tungstate transport system ATP-binding protein